MTIEDEQKRLGIEGICLLPSEIKLLSEAYFFELPASSNNESSSTTKLLKYGTEIYQVTDYCFGKGRKYEKVKDEINDRYHYDEEGKPLRSAIHVNSEDKTNYTVLPNANIKYFSKYDLTYNLIGFKFKDCVTGKESEYFKPTHKETTKKDDDRYLTLRDHQDMLIDNGHENWSQIPSPTLEHCLSNISDQIEEAGDKYYKITLDKILNYLKLRIVNIVENFPNSISVPPSLDKNDLNAFKIFIASNILVSLVPKIIFVSLQDDDIPIEKYDISVKQAFHDIEVFYKTSTNKDAEQKILLEAATKVGMPGDSGPRQMDKKPKKVVPKKPKVAVGRGAIDGFFKKK